MIDKSILLKKEELKRKSISLQGLYMEEKHFSKFSELKHNQNEIYKKYQFYNNLIKNLEKVNQ